MKTENSIVTGSLSFRGAQIMNLILAITSVVVGVFAGPYWTGLPIVAIILVVLYDLKPFRLKDRPLGFLVAPIQQSLPFLFSYAAATSSFALSLWNLSVFTFLYFNGVLVARYLPDMEFDLKLGIRNFSTAYGAEATRRFEIAAMALKATIYMVGVVLGVLSPIGLPLLLVSVTLQARVLALGVEALKNPINFRRFAIASIPNTASIALSMI